MTADLSYALSVAKYSSRCVYGIRREESDQDEMIKLLAKQIVLQILSDSTCLEELSSTEVDMLSGFLTLKTYG